MFMKKTYIILGIGVGVGVFTCAVHLLHRKNKEEVLKTRHNRVTRTIKIPKDSVGHVLGRHGANIKSIREKTKARIVFDDQGDDFTVATVSGTPEEVEDAVNEINHIITSRHGIVTREIEITENMTDSFTKNIHVIRQICDMTKTRITFEFLPPKTKKDLPSMKIVIKGKKNEVDSATEFIDNLVAEVQLNLNKPVHVAGRALPNSSAVLPINVKNDLPCEILIPSHPDGYVDVYVSAVDTPNKFWVQISGSKSIQLDKLATEMTEFYDDEKNKAKFLIQNINIGDVVAAYYQGDSSWYRAEVLKILDDDDANSKISVFYLDFGDCAILGRDCVSVLKPEFLSIPFQAIECSLADVESITEEWSQEACAEFEKMVYLGSWKVIMAKLIKRTAENSEESSNNKIHFVELLDTNTKSDISISKELVSKGHARYVQAK